MPIVLPASVPVHIAIILDGNGRWAKKRYMPRFFGHKAGVDNIERIAEAAAKCGVKYLTVFAFSTENWKRPTEEISGMMSLILVAASKYLTKVAIKGGQVRIIGDLTATSDKLRRAAAHAEQITKENRKLTILVAFNYGGRWDMLEACRKCIREGLAPDEVTEEQIGNRLSTSFAPAPDLLIRTGGEARLSNFLLWQCADSVLYFTNCLWPDFDEEHLHRAIAHYKSQREEFDSINQPPY